jgi:hypothetical protein
VRVGSAPLGTLAGSCSSGAGDCPASWQARRGPSLLSVLWLSLCGVAALMAVLVSTPPLVTGSSSLVPMAAAAMAILLSVRLRAPAVQRGCRGLEVQTLWHRWALSQITTGRPLPPLPGQRRGPLPAHAVLQQSRGHVPGAHAQAAGVASDALELRLAAAREEAGAGTGAGGPQAAWPGREPRQQQGGVVPGSRAQRGTCPRSPASERWQRLPQPGCWCCPPGASHRAAAAGALEALVQIIRSSSQDPAVCCELGVL